MRVLLIATLALGMTAVYRPNSIIPKHYVDRNLNGQYRVYDSKQIVVPKYIVKTDPAGEGYKVFPSGKPVLPVYRIEKRG